MVLYFLPENARVGGLRCFDFLASFYSVFNINDLRFTYDSSRLTNYDVLSLCYLK